MHIFWKEKKLKGFNLPKRKEWFNVDVNSAGNNSLF